MIESFSSPVRGHHETLQQSVENPVRAERLPVASSVGVEHRTSPPRAADRKRLVRWTMWATGWRLLAPAAANYAFLTGTTALLGAADFWFAALLLIALVGLLRGALADRSAILRGFAYFLAFVAVTPTLFRDRPYYDFFLASLAATLLVDRIATHAFFAATLRCTSSRERRRERLRWRNRFAIFDHPSRTIAGYPVLVAAPLVVYALILWWRTGPALVWYFDDFRLLVQGFLVLAAVGLLTEPLIVFLCGGRAPSPRQTFRTLRSAVIDWLTYNWREVRHPGLFQSPGGRLPARAALFFGALLAMAVAIVHLSVYARADFSRLLAKESATPSAKPLEPYQQALLNRLPPEEQTAYRTRLEQEAILASADPLKRPGPGAATLFLEGSDATTVQDFNDLSLRTSMLAWACVTGPFWLKALANVPGMILAPLYLLACLLPAIARAQSALQAEVEADEFTGELSSDDWNRFVDRLQNSPDSTERESVFLGLNAADHSPVIVPRRVFEEHAHILGDSGSGKTALGLAPLTSQLIRARNCSVVIIDLKGDDHALFENARIEAANSGLPFRWFSNELGHATFAFNPLLQRHLRELSLYQRTDLLTASLGLQYGTDYGRGFFSDANAELLYHALRARPDIESFVDLAGVLKQREPFRTVSAQLKMAGSHLAAIVTRLGATEALNVTPSRSQSPELLAGAIDMRQPFEQPQVVYFHLASALGTATTAEIARMAMFSLLSASKFVARDRHQVYLVVDEFQRVVSNNLELFLQTARSMNIGVILANQSLSDLKKPDVDIVSTVRTNTRFRQVFAVGEMRDLQEVIFTSGETLIHNRSWTEKLGVAMGGLAGGIISRTSAETVVPRLRTNDLLLASDHPLQSVVQVRRGDGYAQYGGMPFVMSSSYHISQEEYAKRRRAEWPKDVPGTLTPTLATTDPVAFEHGANQARKGSAQEKKFYEEFFKSLDKTYEMQKEASKKPPDESTNDEPHNDVL